MSSENGGSAGTRSSKRRGGRRKSTKLRRFNNIESVIVEEPFTLSIPENTPSALKQEAGIQDGTITAGDGYYVSATNGFSRYYGLLISKEALKAASLLHFQDEADSLDLNRRMKALLEQQQQQQQQQQEEKRKMLDTDKDDDDEPSAKRRKLPAGAAAVSMIQIEPGNDPRAIQKFQYILPKVTSLLDDADPGYRILLATFVNETAASPYDEEERILILKACNEGGDFVGPFYYQYENIEVNRLACQPLDQTSKKKDGIRLSMGFQTFLHSTAMPAWFPLSNLQFSQRKLLSRLNMKRNSKGGVTYNVTSSQNNSNSSGIGAAVTTKNGTVVVSAGTHMPMEQRSYFRVGILGGGIAGLSCAKELMRRAQAEGIRIEVVVLEARSRLGGRLETDSSTFQFQDGSSFPVDLGASWIHGIDHNPLAMLSKEANVDFVTASEEVRMIKGNMEFVDNDIDDYTGKLYDTLLDQAAEDVWESEVYTMAERSQHAVRWYAEVLPKNAATGSGTKIPRTDAASHRYSSDVSIDHAMGKVISKHNNRRIFRKFGPQEHSLLLWNTKNIEYALGANIADLSMKFWDSDERHAFEGDHVLLKQGYSSVVRHLEKQLHSSSNINTKFRCELNFPVTKVEYARKTTTSSHPPIGRKLIELSDTCSVTGPNEKSFKFDFIVSTLPLGVLKESVAMSNINSNSEEKQGGVIFEPSLPFTKVDAIHSTGFGLLNKVYLQFKDPFWRIRSIFDDDTKTLFGNASGLNPHHYMFFDVGKSLGKEGDKPPILMTLISGKEAVACELMTDQQLVNQVVKTLQKLFTETLVGDPVAFKVTRWGSDKFSRGCYTFLPPGATDQDFQILQSPINGNGDSLTLEGSETMRLFWAGEHTTALHPSMAHGAMLSGARSAEQVISTIKFKSNENIGAGFERLIPMVLFRKKNPFTKLQCALCHRFGSRVREGGLLALQKGSRQVLFHNNCGEFSPEVEVKDGQWKSLLKAVNRGKHINCCMCGNSGATIGCSHENCSRCFHFLCAENTGWRFLRDGKLFFCDLHRKFSNHGENECDQVSIEFYKSKFLSGMPLRCAFCWEGNMHSRGEMLAFSQQRRLMTVHDRCARYTNIMDTLDDYTRMIDTNYKNLFEVLKRAKQCVHCKRNGATIKCAACDHHYHYACCAEGSSIGWNFSKKGIVLKCCQSNREKSSATTQQTIISKNIAEPPLELPAGLFQHNLFFSGAARANGEDSEHKGDIAVNDKVWERTTRPDEESRNFLHQIPSYINNRDDNTSSSSSSDDEEQNTSSSNNPMLMPLSGPTTITADSSSSSTQQQQEVIRVTRSSIKEPWDFHLSLAPSYKSQSNHLIMDYYYHQNHSSGNSSFKVIKVNEKLIGSSGLACMQEIITLLQHANVTVDFLVESYYD